MKVFCGIDWSERHHDVALVDQDGTLIAKRRIGESMADFAELLTLLAEAGDSAEEPIPVAIETSRGLLVAALRATGRPIYAIGAPPRFRIGDPIRSLPEWGLMDAGETSEIQP